MADKHKLSFTAAEIDERLRKVGEDDYYSTQRDGLQIEHTDITYSHMLSLYDGLMAEYPDNVQKIEVHSNDGTFTNYVYEISTGEYSTDGTYATDYVSDSEQFGADEHITKPKYLVLSGIHGDERKAAVSTYLFIRDVLVGHNVSKAFKEGVRICVMPVGNPDGFNAFTRKNGNAVDINRNFSEDTTQKETQAIANWLAENLDANLFVDVHNSGELNEIVTILGEIDNDSVDMAKKIALQGINRIIPFWRDVIGYPDQVETSSGLEDVIFVYSAGANVTGSAFCYASNNLSIPAIAVELVCYDGNWSDWLVVKEKEQNNEDGIFYQPRILASGAEALGNILIEFYRQSLLSEVNGCMQSIDNKLDALLDSVNSGFHVVRGSVTLESNVNYGTPAGRAKYTVDCPSGAKLFVFRASEATEADIKAKTDNAYYITGVSCGFTHDLATGIKKGAMCAWVAKQSTVIEGGIAIKNDNGCEFEIYTLLAGTYDWTAYYWND